MVCDKCHSLCYGKKRRQIVDLEPPLMANLNLTQAHNLIFHLRSHQTDTVGLQEEPHTLKLPARSVNAAVCALSADTRPRAVRMPPAAGGVIRRTERNTYKNLNRSDLEMGNCAHDVS